MKEYLNNSYRSKNFDLSFQLFNYPDSNHFAPTLFALPLHIGICSNNQIRVHVFNLR